MLAVNFIALPCCWYTRRISIFSTMNDGCLVTLFHAELLYYYYTIRTMQFNMLLLSLAHAFTLSIGSTGKPVYLWYKRWNKDGGGARLQPIVDFLVDSKNVNSALVVDGYQCIQKNLSMVSS